MKIPKKLGLILRAAFAVFAVCFAALFFFWPAMQTFLAVRDKTLAEAGISRYVPRWFESLSPRFESWADSYMESGYGAKADSEDVAATEWPIFGVVFYLRTAADLHHAGLIDATKQPYAGAVRKALEVAVSPEAGTWTRVKWGEEYLSRENLFYRMLLIMALASYEEITGDKVGHEFMALQRGALNAEMLAAPNNVLNDYPEECWPCDLVWAAAAIKQAARLEGADDGGLGESLMRNLDGPLSTNGLPFYKIEFFGSSDAVFLEPRGCGNSSALIFAPDADAQTAAKWFDVYARDYWRQNAWVCGFRETPRDSGRTIQDIDSGLVIGGFGSMASAFGIGAARANGRYDIARPLTLEAVAASWPTPFGFALPRLMGRVSMGGDPLGEAALLFSMSRPDRTGAPLPAPPYVPLSVRCAIAFYALTGLYIVSVGIRVLMKKRKPPQNS